MITTPSSPPPSSSSDSDLITTCTCPDFLYSVDKINNTNTNTNTNCSKVICKPVDKECPICLELMDPQTEEIDYCDRTCGNNVQLICTTIFSKSPFCRADWNKGKKNEILWLFLFDY